MTNNKRDTKSKKGDKISFREKMCKSLDLQPDVFEKDTLIEIRDRYRVGISGECRILSYSPTEVRLKTRKGTISIVGKRLFCSSYSQHFIEIEGEIAELSFGEDA